MPTEAEIEAAKRVNAAIAAARKSLDSDLVSKDDTLAIDIAGSDFRCMMIAALAAAEEVRGRAVPDEAAIRADERERCAKIVEAFWREVSVAAGNNPRLVPSVLEVAELAFSTAASRIRAAAPKPEDKP